mmetsp:Transcript_4063/g.5775  ORF Transcript_4063/g.5775 Transcript_4063/m.5775 type:complete len:84 (-) Transcript_4063:608-859(-)
MVDYGFESARLRSIPELSASSLSPTCPVATRCGVNKRRFNRPLDHINIHPGWSPPAESHSNKDKRAWTRAMVEPFPAMVARQP